MLFRLMSPPLSPCPGCVKFAHQFPWLNLHQQFLTVRLEIKASSLEESSIFASSHSRSFLGNAAGCSNHINKSCLESLTMSIVEANVFINMRAFSVLYSFQESLLSV